MTEATGINVYATAARSARDQRILEHVSLVKRIAYWYAASVPRCVEPADLVSAGMVGLIRAVDLFEPERGVSFETFAARYIRGAVLDHLRAQDPLPYSTRVKVRRLDRAYHDLQQSLQRSPTVSEVAAALDCSVAEASDLMAQACAATLYSLEELSDLGQEIPELETDRHPDPLGQLEAGQLRDLVVRQLQALPRPERLVLTLYYYERLKMKDIGKVLGVTESRVSQLHAHAVTALRCQLRETLEKRG